MKNIKQILMLTLFLGFASTLKLNATKIAKQEIVVNNTAANNFSRRVQEIAILAKSDLSSSEKKVLRNELKSIRTQLKDPRIIYISTGTLILIIILLIILL